MICESERRVKRKPLANKYKPIAWITNTQTRTIKLFIEVAGKNGDDRCVSRRMSSYHIQDLRLLLPAPDFDLRVNRNCAKTSPLFQEWLQESFHGDAAKAEELLGYKFDLLCSICFPTIDPPQLLRVSKLCALTFLTGDGYIQAETSPPRQDTGYVPHVGPMSKSLNGSAAHNSSTSLPNLLDPDHLLEVARSVRTGRARELEHATLATAGINVLLQLGGNLLSRFYSPQETKMQTAYPGLLEFLVVLEAAYDRKFPEELVRATPLTALWGRTANIVIWTQVNRRRKRMFVVGGLTSLSGPCFVHIQASTKVPLVRGVLLRGRAGFHPAGSCERHRTDHTIRG